MVVKRAIVCLAGIAMTVVLAGCPSSPDPSTVCGEDKQGRTPATCQDHAAAAP